MPETLPKSNYQLEKLVVAQLQTAGRAVHHTSNTSPHILSSDGTTCHHFHIDKYSNKDPEALVFYFNSKDSNLPKATQKTWGTNRRHHSSEVKIIVAVCEAEQLIKLVPRIIKLLEELDYKSIRALLPFALYTHPEDLHRICTVSAMDLLK